MNKQLLPLLLLLVAIALIGGFWVVGGPQHGRMEKMDRQRMSDLREISRSLKCVVENTALPQSLEPGEPVEYCNRKIRAGKWKDPVTGLPYEYRLLGGNRFEICAQFALPDVLSQGAYKPTEFEIDGNRGCIIGVEAERKTGG